MQRQSARCVSLCRYALTGKEVMSILMQRLIKVDGKVRTDTTFPAGFMDVISIEKTDEHFRLVMDTKGRFVVHRISKEEAAYKLCRVSSGQRLCRKKWRSLRSSAAQQTEESCDETGGSQQPGPSRVMLLACVGAPRGVWQGRHPLRRHARRPHHPLPRPRGQGALPG